jgi:uncharacterized protein (DUF58 family)
MSSEQATNNRRSVDRRRTASPPAALQVNTWWPWILTVVLLLTQLVFPSKVWVVLLCTVGGLSALSYLWARQIQQHVRAERRLRYGWVQVGDRLEEAFTLDNRSWLPVLWAEVVDRSDLPGYEVRRIAACSGLGTTRWTTEQVCSQRGVFTLGPWSLRISDPFGFFSVVLEQPQTESIAVYPQVVQVPHIALPRGLETGPSRAHQRTVTASVDVAQTRAYQPEDPLRLIHWRSTAHRGDLIVRAFDTEISGDLWIVVDLDQSVQAGTAPQSTEEYAIVLAASLADRTLRQNRAVGLLASGEEQALLVPGRGKRHMWRLLHALAAAQARGTHPLAEVLHGMRGSLGQGTTVLVITASCDPDWLDALLPLTRFGVAPSVVLLDAASFAGPQPPRSSAGVQAMQDLFAGAGVSATVIDRDYPLHPADTTPKRGYWEFKVSPLGRAVLVRRPEQVP